MKDRIFLFLSLVGLIAVLSGCEKDETRVVMSANPVPPSIKTLPDLNLQRVNGAQTIFFTGTPVDPGFQASATYFLEVDIAGTNFDDALVLYSGVSVDTIRFTISDLNGLLLRKFTPDQIISADFRIRSLLVVDAGTGALGTSTHPLEYISATQTANINAYGLPRLNLINSGMDQKIESALGDGAYFGYVKLDVTKPFTLHDPDANITYGADGTALAVNGAGILPPGTGWHELSVNTVALTYNMSAYMIGLVGSATPNGWNTPDQKMDYNPQNGTWYITIDLIVGEIKFRKNDGWAWNLGGTPDNLVGDGANLPIPEAGNYTIVLTITDDPGKKGTCTIKKN